MKKQALLQRCVVLLFLLNSLAEIISNAAPPDKYEQWVIEQGLTGSQTNLAADPDKDGLNNYAEYAFGGNPGVDDAKLIKPVVFVDDTYAELVYRRRMDDGQLTYDLWMDENLVVDPNWTNVGKSYEVATAPSLSLHIENVTNRISSIKPAQFFQVKVSSSTDNVAPLANAGIDRTVLDSGDDGVELVNLDGSNSSDLDGRIDSYVWKEGDEEIARGKTASVTLDIGKHFITLSVTDDDDAIHADSVVITILEASDGSDRIYSVYGLPEVVQGAKYDIVLDYETTEARDVLIYCRETDGSRYNYVWKILDGVSGLRTNQTFTVQLRDGEPEIADKAYTFFVCLIENGGGLADTIHSVELEGISGVLIPSDSFPPVADTGRPYMQPDPDGDGSESILLDGSGSFDPDGGNITRYSWSFRGETTPFVESTSPTVPYVFDAGFHEIQLSVLDDDGEWSEFSRSSVRVGSSTADLNVLFIGVDDYRTEMGTYNGALKIITPNFDAFASRSMVFERAYCQQSVCTASRASLLTGARPDTTKVTEIEHRVRARMPQALTLPRLFRDNGYKVLSQGKIFHQFGEDDAESWSEPAWKPPRSLHRDPVSERVNGKPPAVEVGNTLSNGRPIKDSDYQDGANRDQGIKRLGEFAKTGEKFFLAMGFNKPHLPFCAPAKYWNMYNRDNLYNARYTQWPSGMPSYARINWPELGSYWDTEKYVYNYRDNDTPPEMPESKVKELIHGYYACVSYVDAMVGDVLDELDRLGLRESTIVVLWGDHGWKLNDYGAWSKQTTLEIDNRVPLIIDVPGYDDGRTKALVELVDLYPTLAELCGIDYTGSYPLEGTSMIPVLKDPNIAWKQAAFSQYPRYTYYNNTMQNVTGYSIRSGEWRYTEWWTDSGTYMSNELYRHVGEDDLLSGANLALSYPDKVSELKQLLHQQVGGKINVGQGWRTIQAKFK